MKESAWIRTALASYVGMGEMDPPLRMPVLEFTGIGMNIFFTIRRLICWFRGELVHFFTVVVEETPDNAVGGILYPFRTSGEPWGSASFVRGCGEP